MRKLQTVNLGAVPAGILQFLEIATRGGRQEFIFKNCPPRNSRHLFNFQNLPTLYDSRIPFPRKCHQKNRPDTEHDVLYPALLFSPLLSTVKILFKLLFWLWFLTNFFN